MDNIMSAPGWEMLSGFPSCTCATNPLQLPTELGPGVPAACSHLYVKKSAVQDNVFHISMTPATTATVGNSPGGMESDKPQGVRVLRGGPMTIVIHPTPPGRSASTELSRELSMVPRSGQTGPTFSSLADERAADDLGVLLMGGVSRANSPLSSKKRTVRSSGRSLPLRRSRSSSADSPGRKSNAMYSVTLKMSSRAFEVDIKLEKVLKDATARSTNELAERTNMLCSSDTNGEKENLIRCYKHTISSLISSRIGDLNRESRMLQESECKRKGAHRPHRPPPSSAAGKTTTGTTAGSMRCLYDSFSKHMKRQPRQFSFH